MTTSHGLHCLPIALWIMAQGEQDGDRHVGNGVSRMVTDMWVMGRGGYTDIAALQDDVWQEHRARTAAGPKEI